MDYYLGEKNRFLFPAVISIAVILGIVGLVLAVVGLMLLYYLFVRDFRQVPQRALDK